ncbi:Hypothetical_protein [Hexamita inflata]|uniref:Hypothetical_protein n=1 Tax=Hexamita inflata TaxID=28002 RepID=A0AA86R506_9EUKA|nr:Hypothetical protein HINF_LOCUS54866 [Hexamita inflata]
MKSRTTPKIPSRLSQIKTSSDTSSMTPTYGIRRQMPYVQLQSSFRVSQSQSELVDDSLTELKQNIQDNIKTLKLQIQLVGNVERYCDTQLDNIQILFRNQKNLLHHLIDERFKLK